MVSVTLTSGLGLGLEVAVGGRALLRGSRPVFVAGSLRVTFFLVGAVALLGL